MQEGRAAPQPPALAACLAFLAALALGCGSEPNASQAAKPQVRHATVAGARLAYYTRGKGTPLLLNMGSASTMSEWDPALLDRLAAHHRLIVYDYRGIGRSSPTPRRGLTIQRLADDAAGLLDRLGIERADVLGWSLGGFVAQQLAIRHPEKVSHLILAATNPGGSAARLGPQWAQRIDSDPHATDAEQLSTNFPRTPPGRRAARAFLRRLELAADAGTIPDDFTVPRNGYLAQLGAEDRWLRSDANTTQLGRLSTPTLVADGTQDVLTPPANSRTIARRVPKARLTLYPGTGHAFLFQENARFAGQVDRFLSD